MRDGVYDDAINEAINDAAHDGGGRMTAATLQRRLSKYGLIICREPPLALAEHHEIERLRNALSKIAGKNDLSNVEPDLMDAACANALQECEIIARAAIALATSAADAPAGTEG